jgi:hypothetical protein
VRCPYADTALGSCTECVVEQGATPPVHVINHFKLTASAGRRSATSTQGFVYASGVAAGPTVGEVRAQGHTLARATVTVRIR